MNDLVGLRLDAFQMAKYSLTLLFSEFMNGKLEAFSVVTDWDLNFDPTDDYTNKTGEDSPKLEQLWSYVEKTLEKFELAENALSCSFYFKDIKEPIVFWKDSNQPGELLTISSETNWWTIG